MSTPLPHRYFVIASGATTGHVNLTSTGLDPLASLPPAEFGGPGDKWSPETLLVAAVADCFVLTFRGVTRAANLPWTTLKCEVEGKVDRVDRSIQFTGFFADVALDLPSIDNLAAAERALHKAEQACLIGNSLKAPMRLHITYSVAGRVLEPAASGLSAHP
jgi:organic hydroperoxide reductase OsmC/OhrA